MTHQLGGLRGTYRGTTTSTTTTTTTTTTTPTLKIKQLRKYPELPSNR